MTGRHRPSKSAGTYGLIGVLRHPSRILKPPSREQNLGDLDALRRGETRRISCFLRGSYAPYPERLRQGTLYLAVQDAQWEPFWSVRRTRQEVAGPVVSVTTRPADHREPNVKHGGNSFVPSFTVVTCDTPHGAIDLVVPSADAALVASYFKTASPGNREHGRGTK
jgi:hypothetical protein